MDSEEIRIGFWQRLWHSMLSAFSPTIRLMTPVERSLSNTLESTREDLGAERLKTFGLQTEIRMLKAEMTVAELSMKQMAAEIERTRKRAEAETAVEANRIALTVNAATKMQSGQIGG
jgi:translation initiation factor 2B subunit (eIF-2B alpha/beta/delta family)